MLLTKWIKVPGPGEYRGQGVWKSIEDAKCSEEDWQYNVDTGYLPTAHCEEKPDE